MSRSSADFDFSFGRVFAVYAYVSRRVKARETCERIVREVLVAHRDLLLNGRDETHVLDHLAASLDRLIERESATDGAEREYGPMESGRLISTSVRRPRCARLTRP